MTNHDWVFAGYDVDKGRWTVRVKAQDAQSAQLKGFEYAKKKHLEVGLCWECRLACNFGAKNFGL